MDHDKGVGEPGRLARKQLFLTGVLQGIGCRPQIYRLATKLGLAGWVLNGASGVHIEVEGPAHVCHAFERQLPGAIPSLGRIDSTTVCEIEPAGEKVFRIRTSVDDGRDATPIPPDAAVCPECVQELFNPADRRYLYPFTTCTLCGPRFTVVRSFPYDRERTSMADFAMCDSCLREYEDPLDRRFHSQTNSCPECGPRLILTDPFGRRLEGDPVVEAIRLLAAGKVVAVKGIGGFHLACDALNHSAVADLRRRKGREEKPFAVMMRDMATVEGRCRVSTVERELLTSTAAPIVLLPKRGDCVAPNVAPFVGTLGVMLPYSPLHHLIFRHPAAAEDLRPLVLVMTSGNYSEEPLARGNDEALERLSGIADAFLMHNRDIELRADDSIMRVIAGGPTVFRTSRGLVPCEFTLAGDAENNEASAGGRSDALVILGAGGDVKNALCIIKGRRAIPGPHIGDLASPAAQDYFVQSAAVLTAYVEASPDLIAVDPHPEYYSNRLAEDMRAPVREVYHHHAHAVSLLTQHRLEGPELFAVFDGAGYGPDGTIWGGEFLVADRRSFTREAHIGLFALPGGEAAIRDPARILAGLIAREGTLDERFRPLLESRWDEARVWLEAMRKGINSPLTSSVGRLFDAAAFAAGFKRRVAFEGQAAMWLEAQADPSEAGSYRIRFNRSALLTIDPRALITQVADDALNGYPPSVTAARFHNAVAGMILEAAIQVCGRTGGKRVGLTGGCFQNRLLTEKTAALLEKQGFEVLLHRSVPPNDGGIALGQAVSQL